MNRESGISEVERGLLRFFRRVCDKFLQKKGSFHVAIAGGKTPMQFYRLLSTQPLAWDRIFFYLSDERYVDITSTASNYRNIRENLGYKARLFPVDTSLPPTESAKLYSYLLPPSLDMALLGVGVDGHTASIFPATHCHAVTEKVCVTKAPDGITRISLTEEYLRSSCLVVFLVKGEEKQHVIRKDLYDVNKPAGRVRGRRGTYLFSDMTCHTFTKIL
ncbi:6-phosphogluconolactonase [Thermocrinis albus DSM 14484]|uniref:6-phosphogluconolactonase n=1 Tax=Thermocrinis albus (strain DSM 14484 / JCM 11386 / HI 11/12) TaxID=638303 RepID=D3SN76_THEAH|nr:6-phosphogluconolactonase [Thermocrinis albus]ADC90206.1 6-phosphogluconolactonase [Thermocrinis albus DSM 14484]